MGVLDSILGAVVHRQPAAQTPQASPTSYADPDLTELRTLRRRMDSLEAARDHHRRADSIENALTGLGTSNDKATQGVPVWRTRWTPEQLEALYRFNVYAAMYIDKIGDEATRKGWRLEIPNTEPEDLAKEQERFDKRLRIPSTIADGVRWGRLYGGCIAVMVTEEDMAPTPPGRSPHAWLQTPLRPERVRRLCALPLFTCTAEAYPDSWETDVRRPEYGEPSIWYVQPDVQYGGVADEIRTIEQVEGWGDFGNGVLIHRSRVIWFRGNVLPRRVRNRYSGVDDSVLERSWDAIQSVTSADQAMAVLTHELKIDVIKLAKLSAIATSDEGEQALHRRLKQIAQGKSLLNAIVIGDDEDFAQHHSPVTGFADLHDKAEGTFSAASQIPKTAVYGEPPSGLNTDGESHRDNWFRTVAAWQETYLRPRLEALYRVVLASDDGPTGGQIPEDWSIEFADLDQPTTETRVKNLHTLAMAANEMVKMGVLSLEQATRVLVAVAAQMGVEIEREEAVELAPGDEPDIGGEPRTDADDYKVPEGARNNARKVLRWREEHPDEIRGMTRTGWARARQLAEQDRIPRDVVNRMSSFNRHRSNYEKAQTKAREHGKPWTEPGIVAWLGWGGTTGIEWARGITGAADG